METQNFLNFNPRGAARPTDPVTSVMAAEQIAPRVGTDRWQVLATHYRHREQGLDDFQLAELMGRKQTSVGRRRGELEHMGFVEKTERRLSPSPLTTSVVQCYRITQKGIDFYEKEGN